LLFKIWDEYFYPLVGRQQAVTILPTLLHPKSRGYVRLRSSDPKDYPIIDPKYFSNKDDIEVVIRGNTLHINISVSNVILLRDILFVIKCFRYKIN
jgi:choline dehydrogenase-like flavoprotein